MSKNKLLINVKKKLPAIKMLSFVLAIISIITYSVLSKYPNNEFWNKMGVLFYGLMFGTVICGMIINMFYIKKIRKMYNISVLLNNNANIVLHVIPFILLLLYAPKHTPIQPYKIIIFSLVFLCIYMTLFDFTKIYTGVPYWVFALFPIIIIISVLVKYRHNRLYRIEHFNDYKKRAIVVYVPNKKNYIKELKNVYKSCKYNKLFKDTDLIVFGEKEIKNKIPSRCIFIEVEDVEKKNNWYRDFYGHYNFMNSIDIFFDEKSKFLENYEYILRTDTDTFITPSFKNWFPEKLSTGMGYYSNENNQKKLKKIAKKLGYNYYNIHNIGSSWYGKSSDIIKCAKLTSKLTRHIFFKEFKKDIGKWPYWWMGVSLLYGGELAVNHLFGPDNFEKGKLDKECSSSDSVKKNPHLHCLQNSNFYSKFEFDAGKYDKHRTDNIDIDKINNYSLYISLLKDNE